MDWQDVEQAVSELAASINKKPDAIIAIVRGGLIPARLLAKQLDVKPMYALTVVKQDGGRMVTTKITDDLSGKNVLLVEDVLETSQSLAEAKSYLKSLGANVKTAALYLTLASEVTPDFFIERLEAVPILPWD